ncbi:zf-HC2 domain-containing protein [Streptomyces sp. NPDC058740]|uniref:zf-HC2 domain-containing protein n=1 Tax=unclassified Streptomyces TaxID=2593676 RepID=UPI0036A62A6F
MTSTADTTQHPDVSEISDLTEGLLSPSRSAAVRLHLDGCPLCADVRTSLEEIRGLLGTLPGPPRMPAEIAGRIDAALAAEALLNATAPETPAHVSRETPRSRPAATPPPADRPAGRSAAATGPGRPRGPRRRRVAALGALLGAAALGLSLFFVQSGVLNPGGGTEADTKSDTAVSAAGAARFDGQPVEAAAQALLQQHGTFKAPQDTGPGSFSTESGGDGQKRTLTAPLPGCVKAGTQRPDAVLGFQQGDYQGKAAYLLVLPDTADTTRVEVYVLDASCATGSGNTQAEVLLRESVPRS